MNRHAAAWLTLAMLLLAGCGATSELASLRLPVCGADGDKTTFLMAQSAPDAALIPCLRGPLPANWMLEDIHIDSAGSQLSFLGNMTAETPDRLEVSLAGDCDTADAVPVPSDEVGAQRLEDLDTLVDGYAGRRYYTFAGGCVTYQFTAHEEGWTGFVHDATQLWSFIPRAQITRRYDAALGG